MYGVNIDLHSILSHTSAYNVNNNILYMTMIIIGTERERAMIMMKTTELYMYVKGNFSLSLSLLLSRRFLNVQIS